MVPYSQMKSHQLPPFIKLRNDDGTETIHYSIMYDGVPNELKKMAEIELNETEEKKRKGLQRLREVLKEEGVSRMDDQILLCVLRKCKYNLKKSEKQLQKFLNTRNVFLEMFKEADLKRLENVLDHMSIGFLPYRDKRGRAIFVTTPIVNLEHFDLDDGLLCYYAILSSPLLLSPMTSIAGVVWIGEAKTPALDIMYQIMKGLRKHLGDIMSLPCRLAKIEVLNEMFIVRWTVNLLKPILAAKSVERINFHGSDMRKLCKTYHPEILPEEFGGTMGPLSNTFYKEEILNYIKRLKNE